ncbi:hypothetical protein GQ44DRAFT_755559 [Phaeosphaeriaceae sp. PMI808]|nr:hypothetical protein GQ44DRAFT_755559 [Phaeosphaeriaceae sp. PMI808]
MSYSYSPSFQLAPNNFFVNFETLVETCLRMYLRPDPGGSTLPWLFSLILLILHMPTSVIRAVKWESAQYLALGLAVLGIALTVQAYVSTAVAASEVLVWMPIALILDIGAMLQMVVLIIERHDMRWRRWRKNQEGEAPLRGWKALWSALKNFWHDMKALIARKLPIGRRRADPRNTPNHPLDDAVDTLESNALHYALVALVSFIFLIMLLILQCYGLYAAVREGGSKTCASAGARLRWATSPSLSQRAIARNTKSRKVAAMALAASPYQPISKRIGYLVLSSPLLLPWYAR